MTSYWSNVSDMNQDRPEDFILNLSAMSAILQNNNLEIHNKIH